MQEELTGAEVNKIIGLDIGPDRSAWCELIDGTTIGKHAWDLNYDLLLTLRGRREHDWSFRDAFVLESPQAQDRPLGKLLRDTIWWAARFYEAIDSQSWIVIEAEERDVALWLTGNRSASNPAILQSLKDIFGDKTQEPCGNCHASGIVMGIRGTKKCPRCSGCKFRNLPGPLAGLNEHERSALAAAWWHWKRTRERRAAV